MELEATIGGRRLRITRKPEQDRPKKAGTGFTREPATVRLDEQSAAGGWENKSTRVVEADQEIRDLMGMSAEQFFQVVLLPQGQFAQFLHAKAQEKEELLRKLFGTDRFRKVEDWLAERRRATERESAAAAESLNRLVAQIAQAADVPVPDSAPPASGLTGAGRPTRLPWQSAWAAGLAAKAMAARDAAADLMAELASATWTRSWRRSARPGSSPTASAAAATPCAGTRSSRRPPRHRAAARRGRRGRACGRGRALSWTRPIGRGTPRRRLTRPK